MDTQLIEHQEVSGPGFYPGNDPPQLISLETETGAGDEPPDAGADNPLTERSEVPSIMTQLAPKKTKATTAWEWLIRLGAIAGIICLIIAVVVLLV